MPVSLSPWTKHVYYQSTQVRTLAQDTWYAPRKEDARSVPGREACRVTPQQIPRKDLTQGIAPNR